MVVTLAYATYVWYHRSAEAENDSSTPAGGVRGR